MSDLSNRVILTVAPTGSSTPAAKCPGLPVTPAEIAGVADRVGSITPGKDADLVLFDADTDPLTVAAKPAAVVAGGKWLPLRK